MSFSLRTRAFKMDLRSVGDSPSRMAIKACSSCSVAAEKVCSVTYSSASVSEVTGEDEMLSIVVPIFSLSEGPSAAIFSISAVVSLLRTSASLALALFLSFEDKFISLIENLDP